jgi:hypothetical protein
VKPKRRPAVGWREWAALPDLGIAAIKVKVDTGARSSSLHAFDVVRVDDENGAWVEFAVHPLQRDVRRTVRTRARLLDERWVRSSSGRRTFRPVIVTPLVLGGASWPVEITLVRRDLMGFRMLVGREALRRRMVVDPGRSFLAGHPVLAAADDADANGDGTPSAPSLAAGAQR